MRVGDLLAGSVLKAEKLLDFTITQGWSRLGVEVTADLDKPYVEGGKKTEGRVKYLTVAGRTWSFSR